MERLIAFWKYLLSFRKTDWTLHDYPIRIKKHPQTDLDSPIYSVQITNWWFAIGTGDTEEEALLELQYWIDNFKNTEGYLPRPGSAMPIKLGSTQGLELHTETAEQFFDQVFDFAPLFISDESSLYDFDSIDEVTNLDKKIEEIFGVNVSDIKDRNLIKIFERI